MDPHEVFKKGGPRFHQPDGRPENFKIRAERKAVCLLQEKIITDVEVLRFLNRLADLLFTLARYEQSQGKPCTL
jgi:hypothetical protein